MDNPSTAIVDGRKTIAAAGTAERIATTALPCRELVITAETDNTGYVVVGGSTVVAALGTRRGTPLSAGQSFVMSIADLSLVYFDVTVSGDGFTYTYMGGTAF